MAETVTVRIQPEGLTKVGLLGIQIIRARSERGESAEGTPLTEYSRKPFARPLRGISRDARQRLGEALRVFRRKEGAMWAVITSGYEGFKRAAYPQDGGGVNLTQSGRMLNSLTVLRSDPSNGTVTIGFTSQESAMIAYYHNEIGAGPSHVLRRFLGFTEAEKQQLAEVAASYIVIT